MMVLLLRLPRRLGVTHSRLLSISRMLDLGGSPSSLHDKNALRIDASKNCKLKAIAFDFEVLTRSLDSATASEATKKNTNSSRDTETAALGDVKPDVSMVQQVATLLNVNLGGTSREKRARQEDDDLSLITGESKSDKKKESSELASSNPLSDIRDKYAAKLAKKKGLKGGVAAIELAKHQSKEATLQRGDAADHLVARKIVASEPISTTGRKWMAMTGTGSLLQYLTQRSMKIVLLPKPGRASVNAEEGERMEDFKKQLSDVVFDLLVKDGTLEAPQLVRKTLEKLGMDPNLVLMVSDRDDYLRSAKDAGMVTCRIRPKNAPRGNVTAHYSVPAVPHIQDVVDEINGISFSAVLQGR